MGVRRVWVRVKAYRRRGPKGNAVKAHKRHTYIVPNHPYQKRKKD